MDRSLNDELARPHALLRFHLSLPSTFYRKEKSVHRKIYRRRGRSKWHVQEIELISSWCLTDRELDTRPLTTRESTSQQYATTLHMTDSSLCPSLLFCCDIILCLQKRIHFTTSCEHLLGNEIKIRNRSSWNDGRIIWASWSWRQTGLVLPWHYQRETNTFRIRFSSVRFYVSLYFQLICILSTNLLHYWKKIYICRIMIEIWYVYIFYTLNYICFKIHLSIICVWFHNIYES